MNLLLNRFAVGLQTGTFGALSIDGVFYCFSLEPIIPVIPVGTWPVLMVDSPTHTPKYGMMPWINWKIPMTYYQVNGVNVLVPDKAATIDDILDMQKNTANLYNRMYQSPENEGGHTIFHPGNKKEDTNGCPLPGKLNADSISESLPNMTGLYNSRFAFLELQKRINAAMINGVTMEIK